MSAQRGVYCSADLHEEVEERRVVLPAEGVWIRGERMDISPYTVERRMVCKHCGKVLDHEDAGHRLMDPFSHPSDHKL